MKVDLHWLSFEKPQVIDLDKLEIRVPYGTETQYTLSLAGKTIKVDSLRAGMIGLLNKCQIATESDPDKILKAIEKLAGEQGKKIIRSALEETQRTDIVNE